MRLPFATAVPGTTTFFFSPSTLLSVARLPTGFGQILDDGSVQFQAIGLPLSFTEMTPLADMPLSITAYDDVDLTVVYPIRGTFIMICMVTVACAVQ